ncbi:MAG: hypothetical protein PHD74_00095 [Candidatus Krumholzibacteria bacterium]|nr:hypothetical protein [Candidatus Krumholzibacteria bacterium]
MSRKVNVAAFALALVLVAVILSCSEDSNYDQRTVVFVSSVNSGSPFLCDVLHQGDSIYYTDTDSLKTIDDYVSEDYITVAFTNQPYSSIVDPTNGSLGDFLVTGYDLEFIPYGGAEVPVDPFSGSISVLVPSGETVEAAILLVPFSAKTVDPLVSMMYTNGEIMTRAHITFHGHEVQTDVEVDFETNISVNFADPLLTKTQENQGN